MSAPKQVPSRPAGPAKATVPPPKPRWWRKVAPGAKPGEHRIVILWSRILGLIFGLIFLAYLSLATALWGYYAIYRQIPDVHWIDVAVMPRFNRVQNAIGAHFYAQAKDEWAQHDYVRAIFTARAAVMKAPANLDARLFLAGCWQQAGRYREAVQALRDGIAFSATDKQLQQSLIEACVGDGRYEDLLAALRVDFPSHGINLLDGRDRTYQLAEVRAVLETSTAAEAEKVVNRYPGLAALPAAAPLLADIDWELGRSDQALARLLAAHNANLADPTIQDTYINMNIRLGRKDEARRAALGFLRQYPHLLTAQLRFLEALESRDGVEGRAWATECVRFLAQYRHDNAALAQLGSLAASKGWTDLAYLLYENSLQENLSGFPFAIYYVASLVKAGNSATADQLWRDLAVRNSDETSTAPYITAMIDWSSGRESESLQILDQLRHDASDDAHRRKVLDGVFREFGFPKLANLFSGLPAEANPVAAPSALPQL